MADSYKLTDGTTEIELQYDSVSQTNYTLQYGSQVQIDAPDVLMHVPDDGEELPVRTVYRNRRMFFTLNANGADWDTVLNNVAAVRRLIRQANRYWVTGDVDRVSMRIQKDSATNYTDHPIKYGYIRDDDAYYTEAQNILGWKPVIVLEVGPYGEGASFTLRNDLPSSPHCIEDSNSDGRPDGWTTVNSPTVSINTNNYLIGGKSLAMSGSDLDGVNTPTATATAPDIAAYVWVHVASGAATIDFRDSTGSVQQYTLTSTDSNEVSDKTITSSSGDTWYRVSYSASLSGNNPFIRILCSGTSQLRIDGAYLQTGTTTVPDAWCSTSAIENRYDPTSSDEARINYVDVWGIPGDAPALLTQDITLPAIDMTAVISKYQQIEDANSGSGLTDWFKQHVWSTNVYAVGSPVFDYELESALDANPGVSDATRHDGYYLSGTAATPPVDQQFQIRVRGTSVMQHKNTPVRVVLIARSSSANTTFRLEKNTSSIRNWGTIADPATVTIGTANQWTWVDLGVVVMPYDELGNLTSNTVSITGQALGGADACSIDIDCAYIFPAEDDGYVIINADGLSVIYTSGREKVVRGDGPQYYEFVGGIWELQAESIQRLIYNIYDTADLQHNLDDTVTVEFTIVPRTRHLLGTV